MRRGVRGHDVRRVAAVRDDAVDAIGLADVLAEAADRGLRDGERIGGVDAALGERRGVRLLTGVADLELGAGEERLLDHVHRRRMHHHRGVNAGEHAAVEEEDLAAAALLGGRADDAHGEADVVGDARRRAAPHRPPWRRSCCGRKRGRCPGARRTRRRTRRAAARWPARAMKAVGRSPTPRVTRSRRRRARHRASAAARSSSNPTSGWAWMR